MSHQIIASKLFVELSDEQQQLLAGGADFELSNSNFANRQSNLRGTTSSSPQGSNANSTATNNTVNTAAQDFLGLGGVIPTNVRALGQAPSLNGSGGRLQGGNGGNGEGQ